MLISDAAKGVCTYSSCLCDSLPHKHLNAIREATLEAPMLPRDFPEPHASRHFALVLFLPLRNCQRPNVYHDCRHLAGCCLLCAQAVPLRSVPYLTCPVASRWRRPSPEN
jgi:hypothetical protein